MHAATQILHESPRTPIRVIAAGPYAAPQGRDFPLHQHRSWEVDLLPHRTHQLSRGRPCVRRTTRHGHRAAAAHAPRRDRDDGILELLDSTRRTTRPAVAYDLYGRYRSNLRSSVRVDCARVTRPAHRLRPDARAAAAATRPDAATSATPPTIERHGATCVRGRIDSGSMLCHADHVRSYRPGYRRVTFLPAGAVRASARTSAQNSPAEHPHP